MAKFNGKAYQDQTKLACLRCGHEDAFRVASNGCTKCGHHLLKVSHRGNLEKSNPFYQMDQDNPYLRQNDGVGANNGRGDNLTRPGDEDISGGLGTRFRGKLSPRDISRNSDDTYEQQREQDIPGSHDDLLHNPPVKDDLDGWFYDPEDALSTRRQNEERQKFPEQSLEGNLKRQRGLSNSKPREKDDSIFNRVSRLQRGVKR